MIEETEVIMPKLGMTMERRKARRGKGNLERPTEET